MFNDESPRSMQSSHRKGTSPNRNSYSPSMNYNYNNGGYSSGNHNGNYNNSQFQQNPQHRRKNNIHRKDGNNLNERIVKQNDIIIRLLKEIRDRLPAPEVQELTDAVENQINDQADSAYESAAEDSQSELAVLNDGDEDDEYFESNSDDEEESDIDSK